MMRGVVVGLVAFAGVTGSAQATVRQGTVADPVGDAPAGAGFDLTAVAGVSDDAAGSATVALQTRAALPAGAWVVGALGTRSGAACAAPLVVFLAQPSTNSVVYVRDGGAARPAQLSVNAATNTVTVSATDPSLAVGFDCALGYTSPVASIANPSDQTDTPATLAAPPPPAATPTPAPPAAPTPAPAPPTTASTPPVAVPKAAKLTVSLDGAPSTIRRNRSMTLKLKIANDGAKTSGKVTVSFAKARGLSGVSRSKRLSAFKPAQKRTLKVKVKLTRSARVATTFKVTVKAGKQKVSSALVLRIGKTKKVAGAPPTPGSAKSPIVGTYWWRNVNHVDYAWDNRALYFVDGGAVYSGFPAGGLPTTCTTPPAKPEDEFDQRDGCLAYTFDAKTGAVVVGDKTGTLKDGVLTIDGNRYYPIAIAAPGSRYTINDHEHTSFSGMCGFYLGCTVSRQFLTLLPDGQFVLSRSTTSTSGDPGLGPFTAVGSYPPDQHGAYEVQAGGRIALSYADGHVDVRTFGVDTKEVDGSPDPNGEGVFLGEDNFYPDPSPS